MGTLAQFAGTSRDVRQSVQDYIRLRIHRLLKPFIGLGLSFFVGDCCLLIYWVGSVHITMLALHLTMLASCMQTKSLLGLGTFPLYFRAFESLLS